MFMCCEFVNFHFSFYALLCSCSSHVHLNHTLPGPLVVLERLVGPAFSIVVAWTVLSGKQGSIFGSTQNFSARTSPVWDRISVWKIAVSWCVANRTNAIKSWMIAAKRVWRDSSESSLIRERIRETPVFRHFWCFLMLFSDHFRVF